MKPYKVLFVDHTAVLGGAELCLLDLAGAYASTSKVLLFQDGDLKKQLETVKVPVEIAEASDKMLNLRTSGGLSSLATVPELWRLATQIAEKSQNYDLILANSQKAFITAALASLKGSPPIAWYLHDILTAKHFSKVNRQIAVFMANRFAAKVVVNSEATGKAFVEAGGKAELLHIVYNGFKIEKFQKVDCQDVETIRRQLEIGDKKLIGLFSRLSYWKGQHILLEAIKALPDVCVVLVGDALFGEQEYVDRIKALADTPELKDRVHWLGFRNDIPALMKACDLIVHTSTEPEPFGRVIVEGQLTQKPVIASAAGGALELIDDGVNGYLFKPGDALALREKISDLMSNPTKAEAIAQKGYVSAKTRFSLQTVLESFDLAIASINN